MKVCSFLLQGVLTKSVVYYDYYAELNQFKNAVKESKVYEDFYSDDYDYQYYFYDDQEPVKITEQTTQTPQKALPTPKPTAVKPIVKSQPNLPKAVAVPKPAQSAPRPVSVSKPVAVPVPVPVPVAVPAPKPLSRANNYEYVYYGSGESNEYYGDEYYAEDLGNKKKKKKKRKKKKQNNMQNGKNIEDDLGDFRCWTCNEQNYSDCINKGQWEYCDDGQKGCFIEERKRRNHMNEAREVESVHTGCKQLTACIVLFHYNSSNSHNFFPQCFQEDSTWHRFLQSNHSTCRQCCGSSECNENWVYGYLISQADWENADGHRRS